MTPEMKLEALKVLVEPLHQAECCIAKLPACVQMGAPLVGATQEQVDALLIQVQQVDAAIKAFHQAAEQVATDGGVDVVPLSGGGNKVGDGGG